MHLGRGGGSLCRRYGSSVASKALRWSIPCACLSFPYRHVLLASGVGLGDQPSSAETTVFGLFMTVLGFTIVFRARLAYGRFWEGITLVERACAVWLNGISNLVAFCSASSEKQEEVAVFQHLLTRLMSVLLSISLCDISSLDVLSFPTLDIDGINPESLEYLYTSSAKQKVVLQWIQRLVVENERLKVVDIAPPILSRVFQEFSIGIVHFIDARKLTTVPFPLPFRQVIVILLLLFSAVILPLASALYLDMNRACVFTFVVVFSFTSIHFISVEIEQPFGDDANDLPLDEINAEFNRVLLTLLEPEAQQTPVFVKTTDEMKQHVQVCKNIAQQRVSSTFMFQGNSPAWRSARSETSTTNNTWRSKFFSRRGNDQSGRSGDLSGHTTWASRFLTRRGGEPPQRSSSTVTLDSKAEQPKKSSEPLQSLQAQLQAWQVMGSQYSSENLSQAPGTPSAAGGRRSRRVSFRSSEDGVKDPALAPEFGLHPTTLASQVSMKAIEEGRVEGSLLSTKSSAGNRLELPLPPQQTQPKLAGCFASFGSDVGSAQQCRPPSAAISIQTTPSHPEGFCWSAPTPEGTCEERGASTPPGGASVPLSLGQTGRTPSFELCRDQSSAHEADEFQSPRRREEPTPEFQSPRRREEIAANGQELRRQGL